MEDKKARAAVKAQIEADKRARAEKAAREKALREGKPIIDSSAGPSGPSPASLTRPAGANYKDTRLQIRLENGSQIYTTTLKSNSSKLIY